MRALLPVLLVLAIAGCTTPATFPEDGWGVQRRDGRQPVLLSISEINAGSPPASSPISAIPVRSREHGRHAIRVHADTAIAAQWTRGAVLLDAELDRAVGWLARLGADEPRAVEIRLTLMPAQGARRLQRRHAAHDTLVIDLLVPVPDRPRSRGAVLEAALATGLHEATHVLHGDTSRVHDEYRASLVAACYRIAGMQAGDGLDLSHRPETGARRDFTRAHSREAALRVKRDLARSLGTTRLQGGDIAGRKRLQAFCQGRGVTPAGS